MDLRHVKSWRVASVSAIISLLLAVMPVNPAHGNVVGDAWGIACDPLKLGHASDNILASVERINEVIGQLKGLEGQTNEDVEARLKQLQGIVNDVISGVNQDIQKAEQAVSAIERQVYNDVIDIVQRVECLAQDLATVQLQEAIVNALNTVRAAHLNIKILGI
jgi:hypothetical protein